MKKSDTDQLIHFLSDMYSVEQQALVQMKKAPEMAGDKAIAEDFRKHYLETEQHARLMHERLLEHDVSPSALKDMIMKLGGVGFLLFARLQPETPGKLLNHAYSYEAMEWAGYEMLLRFAEQVDDHKSVESAQWIKAQELAMMQTLKSHFDMVEHIAHAELSKEASVKHLKNHVEDVHAFEKQSQHLLNKSKTIGGSQKLNEIYKQQLDMTEKHTQLIETHLNVLHTQPSPLKDSALSLGGLNWGLFFQHQSDTPAKLAAFVFAVLHLEIGGYELLHRTAVRCHDEQLTALCTSIITEKQNMARVLSEAFDSAALATLDAQYKH